MRKFALVLSAAAMLVSTSAFAYTHKSEIENLRESQNLPAKFDEDMVRQNGGSKAVQSIRDRYNLGANFTEADIIRAAGNQAVMQLRRRFSIGPNFTCKELRRAYGARALTERMEMLNLKSGFTHDDYILALGRDEVKWRLGRFERFDRLDNTTFELPANSDEYGQKAAELRLQEKIEFYRSLPANFSYKQYRDVVGPSHAGYFRAEYGFSRDASYDDMKAAIAKQLRENFARDNKVPVDWTIEDLLRKFGEQRLKWSMNDLDIQGPINEASLAEAYGARDFNWELSKLARAVDCTEADIARDRGELSVRNIRGMYDLDPGFTEAQIREAAGEDAIASVRITFGVDGKFTNVDLEKAQVRLDAERALREKKWKEMSSHDYYPYGN
jgi:hypothetical protein